MWLSRIFPGVAMLAAAVAANAGELASPVQLTAGGEPLDVGGVGYAAPFVADFDGDGVRDLLVGEFKGGNLRIYPNRGTNTDPRFDEHVAFMDGSESGRVPAG